MGAFRQIGTRFIPGSVSTSGRKKKSLCSTCCSAQYQGLITFILGRHLLLKVFLNGRMRFINSESSDMHKEAMMSAKRNSKGISAQLCTLCTLSCSTVSQKNVTESIVYFSVLIMARACF